MLQGALHLHSTWSDGEFTLAELRNVLSSAGCRFACVTDHADHFDDDSRKGYLSECAALSDDRFRFIAGLEYPCDQQLHIVGYGATHAIASSDPSTVIRHIEKQRAVAVIAHPREALFNWIAGLEAVPSGLEVWNSKYDGRYGPRASTFELLRRLQQRRPDCRAYYGQDLHWRTQYRGLLLEIDAMVNTREAVLEALARGAFSGVKGSLRLPSDGRVDHAWLASVQRARGASNRLREALEKTKALLDRLGVPLPPALKSQARRAL